MKLKEIVSRIDGKLSGDGETEIRGIASVTDAKDGEITFLANRSFERWLPVCRASAIIVGPDLESGSLSGRNVVVVANPALAQITVAELFEASIHPKKGIDPSARVASSAVVSEEASIFPYVCIEEGARIAKDAVIYPFCFIGRDAVVGEATILYPNVTVYPGTNIGRRVRVHSGTVLGGDGFGYVWDGERHRRIPQLGTLEIEDDVEIGANTCIDRASLQKTIIKKGTKIDNLVQIAHSVTIGENSILVSQVGIAGSTSLGRNVVLGGKAGVADHVTIGDNVMAAGGTGITKSVKSNSRIGGNPHMAQRDWLRMQSYLKRLPDLFERMGKIEAKLFPEAKDDRDR